MDWVVHVAMETTDVSASDVEKKLWEEKRREQDKLSSAMGEYLLKGYRMLDSYCEECGVGEATVKSSM